MTTIEVVIADVDMINKILSNSIAVIVAIVVCYWILQLGMPLVHTVLYISLDLVVLAAYWRYSTPLFAVTQLPANPIKTEDSQQKIHTPSLLQRAMDYKYGSDTICRDVVRGYQMLIPLAKQNNGKAMYELADCYESGIGTKVCISQAIDWYKKCYLGGYLVSSQSALDQYYQLVQRLVSAMQTFANNGSKDAMYHLGYYYCHQHLDVDNIANRRLAFEWFKKACDLRHQAACMELARCYYFGYGTDVSYELSEHYYTMLYKEFNETSELDGLIGSLIHQGKFEDAREYYKLGIDHDCSAVRKITNDIRMFLGSESLLPAPQTLSNQVVDIDYKDALVPNTTIQPPPDLNNYLLSFVSDESEVPPSSGVAIV